MDNLRKNVIANYISQIYVALAGILSVPIYARYMGIEAYGVIGFYITLQAWFQVLDVGLSTTLSRESSLYSADHSRQSTFSRVKSLLEWFFLGTAACAVFIFMCAADWISVNWIKAVHIPPSTIKLVIQLMGVVIALRWLSCLYRSMVIGFELQVWLAKLNIAVNTGRFLLPLPIIIYLDGSLIFYFWTQVAVSAAELIFLYVATRSKLDLMQREKVEYDEPNVQNELQGILNFAYGVATTSLIWVILTQTDKLILSKALPLTDYGHFSMAVTLANGINLITGPIMMAFLPRMTEVGVTGNRSSLVEMYRHLTQLVVTILAPVTIVLTLSAYSTMYAWTGDPALSQNTALTLALYATGNTIMSIGGVAYALQYSLGQIRMHVIGNIISALIYVPSVIFSAMYYGAIGAAIVWLMVNLIYLILWVPRIHSNLVPNLNRSWFVNDIGQILMTCCIPAGLFVWLSIDPSQFTRAANFIIILMLGAVSLIFSAMASTSSRKFLMKLGMQAFRIMHRN